MSNNHPVRSLPSGGATAMGNSARRELSPNPPSMTSQGATPLPMDSNPVPLTVNHNSNYPSTSSLPPTPLASFSEKPRVVSDGTAGLDSLAEEGLAGLSQSQQDRGRGLQYDSTGTNGRGYGFNHNNKMGPTTNGTTLHNSAGTAVPSGGGPSIIQSTNLPMSSSSTSNSSNTSSSNTVVDSDPDWDEFLNRVKDTQRYWGKVWEKEGVTGVTSRFRRTIVKAGPPNLGKARKSIVEIKGTFEKIGGRIPPRRRGLIAITAFLIFLFLMFRPASGKSGNTPLRYASSGANFLLENRFSRDIPVFAAPASSGNGWAFWRSRRRSYNPNLAILKGSGFDGAIVDRTTGLHRGVNKAKVLEAFSNPYGFINLVDPYAGGVFNPSILVLPDTVELGWRHLLVARGPERFEVIDGEDTRWESVLGCFLLPLKRALLNLPYMARESELETLKLPAQRKMDFMRCHEHVYDQFVGPEDPRLFFTNDGQPLLVYSQTGRSPNICRAIFIIDARVVIPGLESALKKGGWSAPIVFKEQTDLIREDQFNIEKNWAPFLGEKDELFFHVSLVPQQVYKYVPGLTLRALDPDPPSHNCLTDIVGAQLSRVKFHHATPLLRATLCRRGECVPDTHNTVLFGIVHVKYHPEPYLFYERRVVTWNATAPYDYLSVSKPLTYSGTNQADPIFTVSMSWDHPTNLHGLGLNHGFLDDVVITSFGVFDYGSAYIDILARDLLTDHSLCAGFRDSSLW